MASLPDRPRQLSADGAGAQASQSQTLADAIIHKCCPAALLLCCSSALLPCCSSALPLFCDAALLPYRSLLQVVFRVGIVLLASAQEQLCAMPFERLVAALNGRKFPILKKQPDSLMKVRLLAFRPCMRLRLADTSQARPLRL